MVVINIQLRRAVVRFTEGYNVEVEIKANVDLMKTRSVHGVYGRSGSILESDST